MSVNQGDGATLGAGKSIFKGIVTEVIFDPRTAGKNSISGVIDNEEKLEGCPPNTCIVNLYGPTSTSTVVAYPFFPPHFAVPIKPGEAVWIITPTIDTPKVDECFWVCKIATSQQADDVNFSHPFRNVETNSGQQAKQRTSERTKSNPQQQTGGKTTLPTFMNNTGDGPIIKKPKDSSDNPLEKTQVASAMGSIVLEPIPLAYKRPGDLLLQGSNNASILLGSDIGYTKENLPLKSGNSVNEPPDKQTGTIDIVTGRSRYLGIATGATYSQPQNNRTSFPTVLNTRNFVERKKTAPDPGLAGDLDFAVDASRIFVSMKTNGDEKFGLVDALTGSDTTSSLSLPTGIVSGSIQPVSASAYIVAKSDEIRLIARKQLENEYYPTIGNPEINGSIKIIKEGKRDEDLAAVVLQPDGTIQISGSRIFLGRHPNDGGINESESGAEDALHTQPYIRYQQLEDLLNALLDDIKTFITSINDQNFSPGYSSPHPGLAAAIPVFEQAIEARREEIVNLKSKRIFGE